MKRFNLELKKKELQKKSSLTQNQRNPILVSKRAVLPAQTVTRCSIRNNFPATDLAESEKRSWTTATKCQCK